ncbi:MAG: riboflavin synthase [Syntrophales bacterium]
MFTGIIQQMGRIRRMTGRGKDALLEIEAPLDIADMKPGDSISVNGACLTVTSIRGNSFTADVSAETLSKTNLKSLKAGEEVNLEKSLRMSDFLGGHIVLGHVDGEGKVVRVESKSGSILIGVEVDPSLSRYIVEKGSITVDGISLTVNSVEGNTFFANIIPHTARMTTLGFRKAGDKVNIETDIIGKYVEKFLSRGKGIDIDFLEKQGFIK